MIEIANITKEQMASLDAAMSHIDEQAFDAADVPQLSNEQLYELYEQAVDATRWAAINA